MLNTPTLRFGEFDGEWSEKRLGDITSYVDYRGRAPIKVEKGIFLVTAKNIKKGYIDYDTSKEYVDIDNYDNVMSKGKPKLGDILFTTEAPLGNICQVDNINIALAQRVIKLRGNQNLSNNYLLHYMLSPNYQKLINRMAFGTTVLGISGKALKQTTVFYPTLPEQQKIATFLSAIDSSIEQLNKKEQLLRSYKKGVMQKIFSREIRFTRDDGGVFEDWEIKFGNEIFKNVSNKNHNSDLPILAVTQEHGAIPRDMIEYKMLVTEKSISSYKVIDIGDFIISLRSFQGGIEYSKYKGICSPAYVILKPIIEIEKDFFKNYFKTHNYIQELNKKLEGIRDGKMISFKYFSEIKLPYPSLPEQTKIANFLSSLDKQIAQVSKQLAEKKDFKKGLLQKMFI